MKQAVRTLALAFPALLYSLAAALRNCAYWLGLAPSRRFDAPVIVVGNLSVGGSGKTPAVEYLIRLMAPLPWPIVTLSRGYGRATRGMRWAGAADQPDTIGDEPFQLYRKYAPRVMVVVAENRVLAIASILQKITPAPVILLDDGYQHRRVTPRLSVLLTPFDAPFYADHALPLGQLRESRRQAARADIMVVTKCPDNLPHAQRSDIVDRIRKYAPAAPVFFAGIRYGEPQPFWDSPPKPPHRAALLSGIARPALFETYAASRFEVMRHFRYRDHYPYTVGDLNEIKRYLAAQREKTALIATEKDMVKLIAPEFEAIFSDLPCYYMPIEMTFLEGGSAFDRLIVEAMRQSLPVSSMAL